MLPEEPVLDYLGPDTMVAPVLNVASDGQDLVLER
jgi:hypothetical protein